ncbi:MAG: hypothetical protein LBL90_10690 [Prevotellaceae bacterium]|jgi:hypothetical protein|nr:hypothetical protein [Prevotellaceae bacterium]
MVKPGRQCEFVNRVGLISTGQFVRKNKWGNQVKKRVRVIVSIKGFSVNLFEEYTVDPLLSQLENNGFLLSEEFVYDRVEKEKAASGE